MAAPAFAGSPPGRFHFGPQQAVCIHGQMTNKVRHSGSICICKDDVICCLRSYGKESEMTLITRNHGKTFLTSVTAMPASSLLLQPSWARPGLATGSLMQGPTLILRLPRNTLCQLISRQLPGPLQHDKLRGFARSDLKQSLELAILHLLLQQRCMYCGAGKQA